MPLTKGLKKGIGGASAALLFGGAK